MKKRHPLTLALAALALGACASQRVPTDKPFLWQASHPHRDAPIYLYGTTRSADARVTQLPDAVRCALAGSDVVLTGTRMTPSTREQIRDRLVLPEDQRLSEVLGAAEFGKLVRLGGLQPEAAERITPLAAILHTFAHLPVVEPSAARNLEDVVATQGANYGARVVKLETPAEFLADLEPLVPEVRKFLRRMPRFFAKLLTVAELPSDRDYLRGDWPRIQKLRENPGHPIRARVLGAMTGTRTDRLAERLLERAQQATSATLFVSLDVMQFAGQGGVLQRLRSHGYQFERLQGSIDGKVLDVIEAKLTRKRGSATEASASNDPAAGDAIEQGPAR